MTTHSSFTLPLLTIANDFKGKGDPAILRWRLARDWTVRRLYEHLTNGFPVAVGYYKGESKPSRRGQDFIHAQLIGLDFDYLTPLSAEQLITDDFVRAYAAFTYTTPSHTPESPRLRVFFVTDKPLEGKETYERAVAKLLWRFAFYDPDKACKDAARMFFGNSSPDEQYSVWRGNTLALEVIGSLPDSAPRAALVSSASNGEGLPSEFIQAIERALRFTGRNHSEFLECHCPIHPPDDTPSAGWQPEKHFLWCFHEDRAYLAIEVGERLGIALRDYLPSENKPQRPSIQLASFGKVDSQPMNQESPSPLRMDEHFPFLDVDTVAEYAKLNEYGDAKLLLLLTGERLTFDRSQRQWYWWAGDYWKRDERGHTPELLYRPVGELYAVAAGEFVTRQAKLEAQLETDKDNAELIAEYQRVKAIAKDLSTRPRSLRTHTRAQNVLQIASGLCAVVGNEWDSNPLLLGVKNGIVDLETGQLRRGRLAEHIRKVSPIEYDPNALAPRWVEFISEIYNGDLALASFTQRLFGYCITGVTSDHILPLFYGRGRNGKDTLIETIGYVLGEYAYAGSGDLLIEQHQIGQATPHLYELMGRRLVWITETSEGAKLNVNQVKYITGSGRITARPLYSSFVEFEATHHVVLFTNHKPRVPSESEDYAIWKRLLLIPLTMSFVDTPRATHEKQRDPRLKQKLRQEAKGILAWLVRGCLEWQRQGLNPPPSVLQATEDYARSEDLIGQFLEECCEFHTMARERSSILYAAYQDWAKRNGNPVVSNKVFGERLTLNYDKERNSMGVQYIGLKLRKQDE